MGVLCVDDYVGRCVVGTVVDFAGLDETGVDGVAGFGDDDDVIERNLTTFCRCEVGVVGGAEFLKEDGLRGGEVIGLEDLPESGVGRGSLTAGREDVDLVAALGVDAGEFNVFGLVLFEDEAEGAAVGKVAEFFGEGFAESGGDLTRLIKQVGELGHRVGFSRELS